MQIKDNLDHTLVYIIGINYGRHMNFKNCKITTLLPGHMELIKMLNLFLTWAKIIHFNSKLPLGTLLLSIFTTLVPSFDTLKIYASVLTNSMCQSNSICLSFQMRVVARYRNSSSLQINGWYSLLPKYHHLFSIYTFPSQSF